MAATNTYLMWGCVLLLFILAVIAFKISRSKKAASKTRDFISGILGEAVAQRVAVDLKLCDNSPRTGLVADMVAIEKNGIAMQARGNVADYWDKKEVEAYFRVDHEGSPVFFVFESFIKDIAPGQKSSNLLLNLPSHLRVEKKRHFLRVQPDQADIMMLAVWPISPGKRLPAANDDLGTPALSWKAGQDKSAVELVNISGSGAALRLNQTDDAELPIACAKGRQILGLIVFRPDPDSAEPSLFLFTGEIMNMRKSSAATLIGVEFTNWAMQKPGQKEIPWSHSSPWRGIKPILHWVENTDQRQTKLRLNAA